MPKTSKIVVNEQPISVILSPGESDYISLTDMTRSFEDGNKLIEKWLNNKSTIDYIGFWEQLNNPDFKTPEFGGIRMEAGTNRFYISVNKFVELTAAIGIFSKAGRYGGTYAHKDIAYNFGMWLSPEFYLLVVKEIQRLKATEQNPLLLQWDIKRILSKSNYAIHTEAIKDNILPKLTLEKQKERLTYATEADMLNIALFGCTAKDWQEANPSLATKYNIRDTATINQLIVLSNMESYNAELIKQGAGRPLRFQLLQKMGKEQLDTLDKCNAEHKFRKLLPESTPPLLSE